MAEVMQFTDDGSGYMADFFEPGEYLQEANACHIATFEAHPNPKPQHKYTITRGWEKFAFPKLVKGLKNEDLKYRQKALLCAQELMSTGEAAVQLVGAGAVAELTANLGHKDPLCRERAAGALELVASVVGTEGVAVIIRDGAVEALLGVVDDATSAVREAAFSTLLEVAARSAAAQALLCEKALPVLLECAGGEAESGVEAAMALELMRMLLSGRNPGAVEKLIELGAVGVCTKLLAHEDASVAEGATLVVACLCVPFEGKAAAVAAGTVASLVSLLDRVGLTIKTCATAALMNVTVDIQAKKDFVEAGGVAVLADALQVEDEKLLLNCLQLVANVCEFPPAREAMKPLEAPISALMSHHVAVLQRHAMLAKRAINFEVVGLPC